MEVLSSEQGITREDIQQFEALYSISLPDEFVGHYLRFNGAKTLENWSEGEELNIPFEGFLPMVHGECTIEKCMNQKLIDEGLVVFAINAISTQFYISVLPATYGFIYTRRLSVKPELHCESFNVFVTGLNYIKVKYKLL